MESEGKVMDNYFFNVKFKVSKNGLEMLCHVALICTIYCITDLICTVACQEIEVVRFPSLYLSQLCQPDPKEHFIKKLLSSSGYEISKIKDNFLPTTAIIFFINNKTRCQTYLNKPITKSWCLF